MAREGIAASQEYLRSLELHVGKKGLREFYDGATLAAKAIVAAAMVEKLQELGFTGEIARQFTILTLYDIVVLIDDSSSMQEEEDGLRVKILKKILKDITEIYDLANPKGILSVRFTNTSKGKRGVSSRGAETFLDKHTYRGVARLGTQLEKKVLNQFVWGSKPMTKPLLVIIITDRSSKDRMASSLGDVILNCMKKLRAQPTPRENGSKSEDTQLFEALISRRNFYRNVDYLAIIKPIPQEYKTYMLSKLLVGAISKAWAGVDFGEFFEYARVEEYDESEDDVEGGSDDESEDEW